MTCSIIIIQQLHSIMKIDLHGLHHELFSVCLLSEPSGLPWNTVGYSTHKSLIWFNRYALYNNYVEQFPALFSINVSFYRYQATSVQAIGHKSSWQGWINPWAKGPAALNPRVYRAPTFDFGFFLCLYYFQCFCYVPPSMLVCSHWVTSFCIIADECKKK